jgi:hypothetical protein
MHSKKRKKFLTNAETRDADPDPSDPYVFGPPGSGSGSVSPTVL